MTALLREGLGAPYDEIAHEVYLLDKSGRIDTMWGATVIELKSDLRRELANVEPYNVEQSSSWARPGVGGMII